MPKIMKDKDIFGVKDRVCPQPQKWNELWQILKNKQRVGAGWKPALPLILGAWYHTSNLEKKIRFQEHLTWAEKENQTDEVKEFLNKLNEKDWHHFSD